MTNLDVTIFGFDVDKVSEKSLKFDVPVIIDDHFMMIKGNKKIIQHTLLLKPLVKTGTNTVQIDVTIFGFDVDKVSEKSLTSIVFDSIFACK